jgi:hypothetical protein
VFLGGFWAALRMGLGVARSLFEPLLLLASLTAA